MKHLHKRNILTLTALLLATTPTYAVSETTLDMSNKSLTHKDIPGLLKGNPKITMLSLKRNNIGDAGAKDLAANTTLTSLNLAYNDIGDVGAKALAANTTLKTLNLSDNKIGDVGAKDLAANETITHLDLNYNNIRYCRHEILSQRARHLM